MSDPTQTGAEPGGPSRVARPPGLAVVYWLLLVLAGLALAGLALLISASVLRRYVLNSPIAWTSEMAGLFFVSLFFLSIPFVTFFDKHVSVTLVTQLLNARWKRIAAVLANLFVMVFCLWFAWLTVPWLEFAGRVNPRTIVLRVELIPWMLILPISMALTALAILHKIVLFVRRRP
ncbi:MAG: TRAP transporter small permease [Pseudomonadota bacterium]